MKNKEEVKKKRKMKTKIHQFDSDIPSNANKDNSTKTNILILRQKKKIFFYQRVFYRQCDFDPSSIATQYKKNQTYSSNPMYTTNNTNTLFS